MLKIDREIDKIYNILRKMLFENKMIIKMIKKKKKIHFQRTHQSGIWLLLRS